MCGDDDAVEVVVNPPRSVAFSVVAALYGLGTLSAGIVGAHAVAGAHLMVLVAWLALAGVIGVLAAASFAWNLWLVRRIRIDRHAVHIEATMPCFRRVCRIERDAAEGIAAGTGWPFRPGDPDWTLFGRGHWSVALLRGPQEVPVARQLRREEAAWVVLALQRAGMSARGPRRPIVENLAGTDVSGAIRPHLLRGAIWPSALVVSAIGIACVAVAIEGASGSAQAQEARRGSAPAVAFVVRVNRALESGDVASIVDNLCYPDRLHGLALSKEKRDIAGAFRLVFEHLGRPDRFRVGPAEACVFVWLSAGGVEDLDGESSPSTFEVRFAKAGIGCIRTLTSRNRPEPCVRSIAFGMPGGDEEALDRILRLGSALRGAASK